MHTKFVTFKQFMHDQRNVLDAQIQRRYEWGCDKVTEFCVRITNSADEYFKSPKLSDCKRDMGSLYRFEMTENDKNYSPYKDSFYVDEGGQRLITTSLTVKALRDVIVENNNLFNCEKISNEVTIAYLNDLISDIKENFIPESDILTFDYVIKNIGNQYDATYNKKIINAYDIAKYYFQTLLKTNADSFKNVCVFITENFGFSTHDYKATVKQVRLEKYNEINTLIQSQSRLHRIFSQMSERAENCGYCFFANDHNNAMKKTISKMPVKNSDIEQYYAIKTGAMALNNGASVNVLDNALNAVNSFCVLKLGDYEYFKTFFDDFDLFCALRNKQMIWGAEDTKDNRYLGVFFTGLLEPFTYTKPCRYVVSTYMFNLIKNFFSIKNNCYVEGLKKEYNYNKVFTLLAHTYVYRVLLLTKCDGVSSDERSIFGELCKDLSTIFNNEDDIDKQIKMLRKKIDTCMDSMLYEVIGAAGLTKTSKGTRLMASIIGMEGENFGEWLKTGTAKFLNFNEYDVDHILWKSANANESWVDSFSNLRLLNKVDNKSQNIPDYEGRFIGNDPSFPESMQNKLFTSIMLKDRTKWITMKIQRVLKDVLEYADSKNIPCKIIENNENILAYDMQN